MLKNKTILLFTTFQSVTPSSGNKDYRFITDALTIYLRNLQTLACQLTSTIICF